ncbi:hypothetical protein DSO57_1009713 [Entomophthora muscae]|uniref:Uncharacterized protein n=1 Tax=Entomophthora muscae TaxID=34485 RepID=A0ACC2UGF3_9FUNG|nr:hypothetical protein DSO57_1009713 [Entomophthora muscae]
MSLNTRYGRFRSPLKPNRYGEEETEVRGNADDGEAWTAWYGAASNVHVPNYEDFTLSECADEFRKFQVISKKASCLVSMDELEQLMQPGKRMVKAQLMDFLVQVNQEAQIHIDCTRFAWIQALSVLAEKAHLLKLEGPYATSIFILRATLQGIPFWKFASSRGMKRTKA